MVTRTDLQMIVKDLINYYSQFKVSVGEVDYQKVIDDENGIYELKMIGWHGSHRIYGSVFHIELKKGS